MSDEAIVLIPIIAVTGSLCALIVWIAMWYRRRTREIEFRHKERMAAIEKGLELPPDPPPPPEQMPPHSRYLLRGLIWLGVGLALTFGTHAWLRGQMEGSGWVPVAVGAAYLIFYAAEGRKAAAARRGAPPSSGDQSP